MLVQADSYVQVSIKQIYNIEENGDEQWTKKYNK
jgi:hypothetical protein